MPPLASRQVYDDGGPGDTGPEAHNHLVNPETGLATDYLNIFNELIMLVEQLPSMPEFTDDVLGWKPVSYIEYFQRSSLPGSRRALEAYRLLHPGFRACFEAAIADLDAAAATTLEALRGHLGQFGETQPAALAGLCLDASASLRDLLNRAATLANDGEHGSQDSAQQRADRILASRTQGLKPV